MYYTTSSFICIHSAEAIVYDFRMEEYYWHKIGKANSTNKPTAKLFLTLLT